MSDDYLNNTNLWDTEVEYDEGAELNQQNLVPDDVRPVVTWKLGNRGVSDPKKDKNGRAFFKVHMQGNVVAPGAYYDNLAIFYEPTSIIFSSGTSAVHDFLRKIGQPAPQRCSLGELKLRMEAALSGNPQTKVRGLWEGSIQDGINETTGKTKYKVVLKGMKKFPQRPDGTYNPTVEYEGQQVNARYEVKDIIAL